MNYLKNTIAFIDKYRKLEIMPLEASTKEIHYVFQNDHLTSSWNGRKGNFGDFYLNLSHVSQFRLLEYFQIDDPSGRDYVSRMMADEIAMLFITPPLSIYFPHQVLKFFYNHGIEPEAIPGIQLYDLPADDKCYGNSANWGDYLLSLPKERQGQVLNSIYKTYIDNHG